MKTTPYILIIFSLFIVLISCHNDNESDIEDICHTWEAKTFMSIESVTYPKNENNPILLIFKADGTYQLNLDVNHCSGTFNTRNNNQIEIGSAACTKICCDSEFSEKLSVMFSEVKSYKIEGHQLKLEVPQWGYIEFDLVY